MIQLHNLHVALNFLGYWTLFTLCGLLMARIWLVPNEAFALPELYARWRRMLVECLVLMGIAGVMLLLVRTGEMDEGTLPRVLADLPLVLMHTHFGLVWSLHLLVLAALACGCAFVSTAVPSRNWAACMLAGALMLAFTYSASSHASDSGDFTLAELNDWLHIVAASLWGGGIFVSALLIFPALRERQAWLATVALRLSALSGAALALVLLTGFYNSARQLPGWEGLFTTTYGRVLAVKLAVVGAMMLAGTWNRFVIVPRLRYQAIGVQSGNAGRAVAASRLLFRVLAVDASLALLAIVMAAILVQSEAR